MKAKRVTGMLLYLHLQYHCLPDVAAEAARMREE